MAIPTIKYYSYLMIEDYCTNVYSSLERCPDFGPVNYVFVPYV